MKTIVTVLLLCLFLSPAFSQGNIDVLHYKYEIELSDRSDTIKGKATIRFKALKPVNKISFDLANVTDKKKKGMILVSVLEKNKKLAATHINDSIKVELGAPLTAGQEKEIIITYIGIPDDGLIISQNRYRKRTFFADNWPNRAHHWIPCIDNLTNKSSFEFIVKAPGHYKVVSNGILVSETDSSDGTRLTHWKEDIPLPVKVMVIGVADFAVNDVDKVKGIPVTSWVFMQNRIDGFRDYSIAPAILSFMIDYIGPYPYKKLANVQSKTRFGGMENAGAIFYNEGSVNGQVNQYGLFAHEIAHQWFGDMATEKSFAHLWLSEGFATYLSHLYIRSRFGVDSFYRAMRNDRQEIIDFVRTSDHPVVDSVSPYMELLNANSYQKGGWVLHMLHHELGDSVFRQCIRKYYETYAGKNAETKDFEKIVKDVSGKNVSTFFRQWLFTPGIPQLNVEWTYSAEKKELSVTVKQLQKINYVFLLGIGIKTAPGNQLFKELNISRKEETFTIPVAEAVSNISLDPNIDLLFDLK